jgi:predicted nuclease with TOPRIM domain
MGNKEKEVEVDEVQFLKNQLAWFKDKLEKNGSEKSKWKHDFLRLQEEYEKLKRQFNDIQKEKN